jgi:hypothetical protein
MFLRTMVPRKSFLVKPNQKASDIARGVENKFEDG